MKTILGTMTFSDQVNAEDTEKLISQFRSSGHEELDTAYVYNKGKTEELLGVIQRKGLLDNLPIAGKANPSATPLDDAGITLQLDTSLERLGLKQLDLFYLHMPDLNTPIRDTLEAVYKHYKAGKFKRFGLSNYAAWQVAEIAELCRHNDWMQPTVYQGMYNALTRDVERELFNCLSNYGMAFYVYNPLAGGMLTGKHTSVDAKPEVGRFATFDGYPERYWKSDYFKVLESFVASCQAEGIKPAAAALRWLTHHSALAQSSADNGIILGASSAHHLADNLEACAEGALPDSIVSALDEGWEIVRPACIKYFRP